MTHYIEIINNYDSELDEASCRTSLVFPLLALLRESDSGHVVNIMQTTCASIAAKKWYVSDIRDKRSVE
jgi:hypothetical protein|tara:strand:+ start:565 stop:771 length:207 start_codon:yes stop_codon:yes gene_type:complete